MRKKIMHTRSHLRITKIYLKRGIRYRRVHYICDIDLCPIFNYCSKLNPCDMCGRGFGNIN